VPVIETGVEALSSPEWGMLAASGLGGDRRGVDSTRGVTPWLVEGALIAMGSHSGGGSLKSCGGVV
jgi:hypothetical protein